MSEPVRHSGGDDDLTGHSEKEHGFHVPPIVTMIVLFIVIFYNLGELLKTKQIEDLSKDQSMFSIPTEILARFNSCDYKFLFFCEPKLTGCEHLTGAARVTCELTDNGKAGTAADRPSRWASVPVLNVILAAAGMVPRLPDATLHMLGKRLRRGHLEFSLGMLFILGYITVMVVALRQQGPVIWYFALAVVAGPWLVIGIFWILKHLLAGASYEAEKIATFFITAIGLPGCLMVCIHHDLESLGKVLGGLRKGVGLFS